MIYRIFIINLLDVVFILYIYCVNLADFILTVSRISEPDRAFTRIDMLKVRDQELCRTGTVYYTRRPCGRYEEHESEEECRAE